MKTRLTPEAERRRLRDCLMGVLAMLDELTSNQDAIDTYRERLKDVGTVNYKLKEFVEEDKVGSFEDILKGGKDG